MSGVNSLNKVNMHTSYNTRTIQNKPEEEEQAKICSQGEKLVQSNDQVQIT